MYLNCHTYFSLRYGILSPEVLVQAAEERGVTAMALTDINNTSCVYEFVTRCREAGIRPVLGLEFRRRGGCCMSDWPGRMRDSPGCASC